MLKTHYLKKPLKNKMFTSTMESFFYNSLPSDELLTKQSIFEYLSLKNSPFKTDKAIDDTLDFMVEQGFIRELNRFYLENKLEIK